MRTGNSEKALLPGEEVRWSGQEKTGLEKPAGERRSLDFLWDLDSCGPRRLLGPGRNVEPTQTGIAFLTLLELATQPRAGRLLAEPGSSLYYMGRATLSLAPLNSVLRAGSVPNGTTGRLHTFCARAGVEERKSQHRREAQLGPRRGCGRPRSRNGRSEEQTSGPQVGRKRGRRFQARELRGGYRRGV